MIDNTITTPIDLVGVSAKQTENVETVKFQLNYQVKAVGTIVTGAITAIVLVLFVISMTGLFLFFIGGEILVLDWTRNHLFQGRKQEMRSRCQDLQFIKDRMSTQSPRHVNSDD